MAGKAEGGGEGADTGRFYGNIVSILNAHREHTT
jgi:hypothetical protein